MNTSRRTKGFFEQSASNKPRNFNWHNSNRREVLSDRPTNTLQPPLPPIPIAEQTKTKLSAFHFKRDEVTGVASDLAPKADTTATHTTAMSRSGPERASQARSGSDQTTNKKVSLPRANTFPSTPGDRLTLEELIGHVPDGQHGQENDGPEEILGWNPNSSGVGDSPSRKRKRASSSSPAFDGAASDRQLDSQALAPSKVQHTPLADPATELWRRYGGDGKDGAGGRGLPGLGLDFNGSPHPMETPIKSAGFRRWASTGNDWPSSKTKRQRTCAPTDTSVWSNGPSKVAAMVEKMLAIQRSNAPVDQLVKPKDPSSSSPLPETGANVSPRRALLKPPDRPTDSSRKVQHQQEVSRTGATRQAANAATARRSVSTLSAKDADEFGTDITLDDLADFDAVKTLSGGVASDRRDAELPDAIHPDDFDDDMDDDFGLDDVDEQSFFAAEINATQAQNVKIRKPAVHKPRLSGQQHAGAAQPSSNLPSATTRKPHSSGQQHNGTSHPPSSRPSATTRNARYRRLRIIRVVTNEGNARAEVILQCEAEDANQTLAVNLRASWTATPVAAGDIIHVTTSPAKRDASLEQEAPGQISLDDSEFTPLLILHPDHMLSATTVADAFDCVRKAVLQDRIKVTGETNKSMVYGKILHQVFQQSLLANKWDETSLHNLVRDTVQTHLESLWELGMKTESLAIEELQSKMAEMSAWAHSFVRGTPGANGKFSNTRDESLRVAVTGLIAIEEHVWSPMFGLKGNVDATVQLQDNTDPSNTVLAPFEVKTGKTTTAPTHQAQTSMYTLLMSDRYDIPVRAGILYYLESSHISNVQPSMYDIRQMIQQRNRVAHYIHMAKHPHLLNRAAQSDLTTSQPIKQTGLPAMMRAPFKCGRCYAQQSCFTFHALCEEGNAETAGMIDDKQKNHSMIWEDALGHLLVLSSKKNAEAVCRQDLIKTWFSKWDRLLTFEEHENSRIRKELWTMASSSREGVGRGFANLKICQDLTAAHDKLSSTAVDGIEGSNGKIQRYIYVFERQSDTPGLPFNESTQLTTGEPVVVSSETGQWALAIGYVISASQRSITVAVDRKLGDARERLVGFEDLTNQTFRGVMQINQSNTGGTADSLQQSYRLDKDEFSNGLSRVRAGLIQMMSSHPVPTRLRELIIFGAEPVFRDARMPQQLPESQLGEMNADQMMAANKVIGAEDYALVLGMPGTGKTTTIAHLIRTLLADGKSILLTAYTHTAVDNILLKIRDVAPSNGILRFGQAAKINPAVREFCHLASTPLASMEEIDAVYMNTQIVATTCMGTNHPIFSHRVFDVCIVDEASQITLPITIAPLLCTRKFVLVGDHYQLPPLVQNQAALEGGLDMSLFRQLCEQHPQAIASLGKQYRMSEDIMSISNTLIYDGRLECGNAAVAERRLQLPSSGGLNQFHASGKSCSDCWLQNACQPARDVVFLNTDALGTSAREVLTSSKNMTNRLEGVLTSQLVLSLQALGVASKDIGVITLYRSQISLLRKLFKNASISRDVELDSADRFQGRDKECIIISMVRSNDAGIVGELIKDWRRLNVAFTRARSKLIVIGSRQTLAKNDLMAKFMELIYGNGWALDLPADAETSHETAFSSIAQCAEAATAAIKSPAKKSPRASQKKQVSQRSLLRESASAGNRGAVSKLKQPAKVVQGRQGTAMMRTSKAKEQLAFEIMEDLMAEDWS